MVSSFPQFSTSFTLAADASEFMCAQDMVPDPWQQSVLRSTANRLFLLCSRQAGKSQTTSVLAAHTALYNPDQLLLLLSPSQRQSTELFRKIKQILRGVETSSLETETALTCELNNGSRIVSLPGNASTVRTYTPTVICIDEASRTDDRLYRACRPMLATQPRGRMILLSTPAAKAGYFYEIHKDESGSWEKYRVPADECPRISKEFLDEERRSLPDFVFRREYMCQFSEQEESYFMNDDIQNCFTDDAAFELKGVDDD